MSRLTRDGTAKPVSRDQILRRERGQGNIHFPCSAVHEQDWQPYPVDPYTCYMCDYTYVHETHRRTPDGNGDGPKVSSEDGNGDEGNGNEGRVGDGEKEAKKRKKPLNSCRRQGGNGGDFGGTRKRCRKGSVGPVAANSNIVEINKEAGGGAEGTLSLSKNCTSRESVSPLSRLIRGFRNKYH